MQQIILILILGLPALFFGYLIIYLLYFYLIRPIKNKIKKENISNKKIENKITQKIKKIKLKKVGYILIILGIFLPLLLLMFYGENWVPSKQAGIIYSIMNAQITYENEDYKKLEKDNDRFSYLSYPNAKKYTIQFRHAVGSGLISIVLGGFILIKEMK